jgi:hypothetical protein
MSNWKRWPDNPLNKSFGDIEHPERIIYPDLNDGSPFVIASDYSGEHAPPEFRVSGFLLTTYRSIAAWESLRTAVRQKHLADGRRMSFKALNDALRINALSTFLDAASELNGVLICIGVEKGYSFVTGELPTRQHNWTVDNLNKLIEISVLGGAMVEGLRSNGQPVHWITDDDSIVSNEVAKVDAMNLFGGVIHKFPDEYLELGQGVASQFDDGLRAEDLVAIPDLAAGAYSEMLTKMGKSNIPTSGVGPSGMKLFVQVKTTLINSWRSDNSKPLKHMNAVIRKAIDGQTHISFGSPFSRLLRPGESAEGAPVINTKWRNALEAEIKEKSIDTKQVMRELGLDGRE